MAMWQLTNCRYIEHEFVAECDNTLLLTVLFILGYFLLGLSSSLVFRAVRDALPNNAIAQERILGASLLVLGIGDVSSTSSLADVPSHLWPGLYNS